MSRYSVSVAHQHETQMKRREVVLNEDNPSHGLSTPASTR
jgi:hypothetical protein